MIHPVVSVDANTHPTKTDKDIVREPIAPSSSSRAPRAPRLFIVYRKSVPSQAHASRQLTVAYRKIVCRTFSGGICGLSIADVVLTGDIQVFEGLDVKKMRLPMRSALTRARRWRTSGGDGAGGSPCGGAGNARFFQLELLFGIVQGF